MKRTSTQENQIRTLPPEASPAALIEVQGVLVPAREGRGKWHSAFIEQCKIMFIAGLSLAQISVQKGVPYDTLAKWSMADKWSDSLVRVQQRASNELESRMGKWLTDEREKHIRRSIERGARNLAVIDRTMDSGKAFEASELRDLMTAEEKADCIIRRNLGLEDQGGGSGGARQFAINANSVTFQG